MKKAYEKLWADVVEFESEVVMSNDSTRFSFGDDGNEDLGEAE